MCKVLQERWGTEIEIPDYNKKTSYKISARKWRYTL